MGDSGNDRETGNLAARPFGFTTAFYGTAEGDGASDALKVRDEGES